MVTPHFFRLFRCGIQKYPGVMGFRRGAHRARSGAMALRSPSRSFSLWDLTEGLQSSIFGTDVPIVPFIHLGAVQVLWVAVPQGTPSSANSTTFHQYSSNTVLYCTVLLMLMTTRECANLRFSNAAPHVLSHLLLIELNE